MPRLSHLFVVSTLLCLAAAPAGAGPPLRAIVHKAPVKAVAWSPDGKRLATADQDGLIRLTEAASGKEQLVIKNQGPVSAVVFSHDGSRLGVKTTGGALSLFDAAGGQRLSSMNFGGFQAAHLAFSPDGGRLTAAGVAEHLIWNHAQGGASGSRWGNQFEGVAAVSPDGRITAWGKSDGVLQCFDIDSRNYRNVKVAPCVALAFGPQAQLLAVAARDHSVHLVEFEPGRELRRLDGLPGPGQTLVFSANGKTLAAGSKAADGTGSLVCVWDVGSGRLRRRVPCERAVTALALSPDGRTLVTATDNQALLWNVALREVPRPAPPLALGPKELQALWKLLASNDFGEADDAFRRLAAGGDLTVPFLRRQVRAFAVPAVESARIDYLLASLDAPRFQVRDRAHAELEKLGELAENGLRNILAGDPSPEVRRRAEKLLERVVQPPQTPERVRTLEALELLGAMGTPAARQALAEIGRDALLRQIRLEAVAMLERLQTTDKAEAK